MRNFAFRQANNRFEEIREKLLSITQIIDQAIAEERESQKALLEEILKQEDMENAVYQVVRSIDESFTALVNEELAAARKAGDFMRSGKLQQLLDIIQKLFTAPESVQRLEKMLGAETEEALQALIDEDPEMAGDEMKSLIKELIEEGRNQNSLTPEIMEKLEMIQKVIG